MITNANSERIILLILNAHSIWGKRRLSTLRELEMERTSPRLLEVLRRRGFASLTPFQADAVAQGIMRQRSQILITFDFDEAYEIGEIALLNHVASDPLTRVMVICPNPHHAEKRFQSISVKCHRLGVETTPIFRRRAAIRKDIQSGRVIVGTYQSLNIAVLSHPELLENLSAVLIERLDLIGQPEIGSKLESIIVTIKGHLSEVQYVSVTPPVADIDDLSAWLDSIVVEDHKPEVKRIYSVKAFQAASESLSTLSNFVVKSKGQIMVLCPSDGYSEKLALQLAGELDGGEPIELEFTREQREELRTLSYEIAKKYPNCDMTVKLSSIIPKGIAFFHKGLSRRQRRIISKAWEEGLLPMIVMPTRFAIASGMRATVVFLMSVFMQPWENEDSQVMMTEWQLSDVLLAAGREGRDREGFGIIVVDSDEERRRVLEKYFMINEEGNIRPRLGEVDSTMDDPENAQDLVLRQICMGAKGEDPFSVISRTFWATSNRTTHITRDEILTTDNASVDALISIRTTKSTIERAQKIPDSSVRIVSVTPSKVEGLIRSSTRNLWHHVAFRAEDGVSCTCESWKFQGIRRHRLCKHLVKLATSALSDEEAGPYAPSIIIQALRGLEILGDLQREGLIIRDKTGSRCTDIGQSVVVLGVPIKDAKNIRRAMMKQQGDLKRILYRVVTSKTGFSENLVRRVLDCLPAKNIEEIVRTTKGQPGIIENIIEEVHYSNLILLGLMASYDRKGLNKETFELDLALREILAEIG